LSAVLSVCCPPSAPILHIITDNGEGIAAVPPAQMFLVSKKLSSGIVCNTCIIVRLIIFL